MKAYYNEIDKYCVEWLRNLIAEGLIADGDVDDRSIVDVRPNDLRDYTQCHFFAGIGGWSGALRLAGWPDHRAVWTGSCPCQPFSLAGKQGGFADERHLWPFFRYHIAQRRPPVVFGEQVASATDWLRLVRGDLEAMDYAVGAIPIQAASAGADHLRDRYWFVADADDDDARPQGRRLLPKCAGERIAGPDGVADTDQSGGSEEWQQRSGQFSGAGGDQETCAVGNRASQRGDGIEDTPRSDRGASIENSSLEWVIGADGKARRVKPGICLLAHGVPNRVAKLRALGNAIDLRPAAAFIRACA